MIATISGIPVFNATITDADTGMFKISLVDDPAVMSNFLAFDNARMPVMYAIQDEEKRLVRGCVMRADFPIYRRDSRMGEFYVIYKADQIRLMAEKYLAESRQNNVNTMHQEDSDVTGVQMVQYFIKGAGVSVDGFDDIADGSLFAEFHVLNDEVWSSIKDGTYKGFSLEGVFDLCPEEDNERTDEIVDALDGAFSRLSKHFNTKEMSKLSRLKAALAKALQEFGNVTTDKGILAWDGEEDLQVGDSVFIEDENGENTPAEDGEYKTEDAKVIVVADGKVAEIKDAEEEVIPETPADETPATEEEKKKQRCEEDAPADEAEPETEPEEDEKDKLIKQLEAKVAELEAANAALQEEIAKMQKMSAARPAHEEVETSIKAERTGNRGLDRLQRILSAK